MDYEMKQTRAEQNTRMIKEEQSEKKMMNNTVTSIGNQSHIFPPDIGALLLCCFVHNWIQIL